MNKRHAITVISYAVITMALGMSWYMLLFHDLYQNLGIFNRHDPIIPLGFASMLVQGVIFAYLYPSLFRGINPMAEGIKFSLLMEAIIFSVSTMANAAKIHVVPMGTWFVYQTGFHLLHGVIFGICLGLIYRKAARQR
jgi:hypothetical protein